MLKKKYQSKESAIASYDYIDIASGTGYFVFYGANTGDGSISGSYVLSDNAFYSQRITTFGTVGATQTKVVDVDFDVQFNLPRDINGNMFVSVPLGVGRNTADAGGNCTANVSGSIIHYDGTNETPLGTFISPDFGPIDDATYSNDTKVMSCMIPISETHFKSGEILRVHVEAYGVVTVAGGRSVGIGHDPKNQPDDNAAGEGLTIYDSVSTTFGITTMEVHVPFKMDL